MSAKAAADSAGSASRGGARSWRLSSDATCSRAVRSATQATSATRMVWPVASGNGRSTGKNDSWAIERTGQVASRRLAGAGGPDIGCENVSDGISRWRPGFGRAISAARSLTANFSTSRALNTVNDQRQAERYSAAVYSFSSAASAPVSRRTHHQSATTTAIAMVDPERPVAGRQNRPGIRFPT